MLRRLRKIAPSISMLAGLAFLFWGLAGAASAAHGAVPKAASQDAQVHTHAYGHDVPAVVGERHDGVAAVAPSDADNTAEDANHCYTPGCSFAAVTPALFGAVVYAPASTSTFVPGTDVPKSGAAPPLRPPRLS